MSMYSDELLFFDKHKEAFPIYDMLAKRIVSEIENVTVKVQKSQRSFYNKHLFACVSFARVRKKKDCPPAYIVVTFGLNYRLDSPRIEIATEPYPHRWTHHLMIAKPDEVNDELVGWIKEAAAFSAAK